MKKLALEIHLLGDGFNDQIGNGQVGQLGRAVNAAQSGLRFAEGDLAQLDAFVERFFDHGTGLVQQTVVEIVEQNVETALGADLGDAAAHSATAEDANCCHVSYLESVVSRPVSHWPLKFGLRFSKNEDTLS